MARDVMEIILFLTIPCDVFQPSCAGCIQITLTVGFN